MSLRHNYHHSPEEGLLNQTNAKTIPMSLTYTENPYIYTADFYFGSNSQKTKMRFTTDTDVTIVASADCQSCPAKAYNSSASTSSKKGTYQKTDFTIGGIKYTGETISDKLCMGN